MEKLERATRPGGALYGRPVRSNDGIWRDRFGERISGDFACDLELAAQFWREDRPRGLREAMKENIVEASRSGRFAIAIDRKGQSDDETLKLAAYKMLAMELGYEIGPYQFHANSGTATAVIRKL